MSAFKGYFFKIIDTSNSDNSIEFPLKYMSISTWTSTPNQREELKAYRDDNSRELHRTTASGQKSVFSFTVRKGLRLADKTKIMKYFTDREVDTVQRKSKIEFWDDEHNTYKTGYFYRPNMEFPIDHVIKNADGTWDLSYGELSLEFIEY